MVKMLMKETIDVIYLTCAQEENNSRADDPKASGVDTFVLDVAFGSATFEMDVVCHCAGREDPLLRSFVAINTRQGRQKTSLEPKLFYFTNLFG